MPTSTHTPETHPVRTAAPRSALLLAAAIPLALLALALAAVPAAAAESGEDREPTVTRSYPLSHLTVHEGEVLVWDQCQGYARDECVVGNAGVAESGPYVQVQALASAHEKIARALAEHDVVPSTQEFQVVLVLADRGSGDGEPPLPAAAAGALDDVRDFLPYSRYRLVDQAFVRATRYADLVLAGSDGLPLAVSLGFERRVGDQLFVSKLRVVAPAVPAQEGKPERAGTRQLLETSFAMTAGETVVVGTSRLNGDDQALVVLLTAVR